MGLLNIICHIGLMGLLRKENNMPYGPTSKEIICLMGLLKKKKSLMGLLAKK